MRLAEFMFDHLSGDGAIAAIVSTRVYPMRLPEKSVIPAISWQRIDATREYDYDNTQPWTRARVQVNCWAHTFDDADALGDAVLAALSGYTDATDVQLADAINELDTYEPEHQLFRRILDFRLSYEEVLAES